MQQQQGTIWTKLAKEIFQVWNIVMEKIIKETKTHTYRYGRTNDQNKLNFIDIAIYWYETRNS